MCELLVKKVLDIQIKKIISLFIRYVIIGIKTRIKKEGLIYEKNVYDTPCFSYTKH